MRYALFTALALGLALPTAAQTTYGVRAGLNVSDFNGFDEDDLDGLEQTPALGVVAGAFAEVPLSPQFAIRPEVLYSQKGFSLGFGEDFRDGDNDLDVDYNVDYVEVPVLARVGVPLGQGLEAGLLAGPTFALKVNESFSAEGRQGGVEVDPDELFDTDGEDVFTSFDAGVALGAEVGAGPFFVDLRYTQGLLDINRNEEDDDSAPTIRNGVFSVTGTFKFGR